MMGMGLLCCMGRRAARVAAISLSVIMMSRMPRPRAIEAPLLRAMVCAIVLNALLAMGRHSEMRARICSGRRLVLVLPAHGGGPATARRCCGGSD